MLTGRRFFGLRLWPSERAGAEPRLTPADTPGSGVWRWGRRGPGSPGRLGVVLAADGRIALRQLLDRGGVRAALPPRLGQLALRLAQQIQVIRMQLLQVARQPAGHSPRSPRPQAGPRASRTEVRNQKPEWIQGADTAHNGRGRPSPSRGQATRRGDGGLRRYAAHARCARRLTVRTRGPAPGAACFGKPASGWRDGIKKPERQSVPLRGGRTARATAGSAPPLSPPCLLSPDFCLLTPDS